MILMHSSLHKTGVRPYGLLDSLDSLWPSIIDGRSGEG
jgi:hypothetical protein